MTTHYPLTRTYRYKLRQHSNVAERVKFNVGLLIHIDRVPHIQSGLNIRGHKVKADQCGVTLTTHWPELGFPWSCTSHKHIHIYTHKCPNL